MKTLIVIFLFIGITDANSQKLVDSLLIGKWKTEKVLKKPSNPHYRDIIDSFKTSVFVLNEDHTFELKSEQNSQEFAQIRKMSKGKTWKFDVATQTVRIGDAKDNFSTMRFKVKTVDGKTIFTLEETHHGLELEMSKYDGKKKE